MPMPYKHKRLASLSTIRLIKLENSKIDGQISCQICHAEQGAKEYDALSYIWGSPAPIEQKIRIKDTSASQWDEFEVHKNLWEFLNNAWNRKYFDRWFWTDRICLDQSHGSEELGEQIPRMAEIYRGASQVIAWPGLTDLQVQHLLPVREAAREAALKGRYLTKNNLDDKFPKETVDVVSALRDAEYWQRIWVVQEIVSAKQIVTIVGDPGLDLEWDEMVPILGAEIDNDDPAEILYMMRHWTLDEEYVDLWQWLSHFTNKDFKSTKPHDLVYGILGLAITYGTGGGKSRPHLIRTANYLEHHGYVVIDALFESFPDFYLNPTCVDLLHRTSSGSEIFKVFKGYISSKYTSERHKRLASIFLQTCHALFCLLQAERHAQDWPFKTKDFQEILRVMTYGFGFERAEYTQHTAVLMGLALIFSIDGERERRQIFEEWKVAREMEPKARSPWKCRNHLLPLSRNQPNRPYLCEGQDLCRAWDPEDGNTRQDTVSGTTPVSLSNLNSHSRQMCSSCEDFVSPLACHESIIAFQIPEAGFEMELEYSRDDCPGGLTGGRISVWFWLPDDDNDDTDTSVADGLP